MAILGTGFDQTELSRIRDAIARFGDRFLNRCYTAEELRFAFLQKDPVPRLAARYAAKEAGSKALGTGIARGILWREIEVTRRPGERPLIHFHGRAAQRAARMGIRRAHVSLTHSRELGAAMVIV
ncbi:MAG TPA: holo-ACP synthase, partial [Candidatus Sumerlaeota bacterium]|nr:holo-ACP synthase [Candidatus Sumerlaeota bacterium]